MLQCMHNVGGSLILEGISSQMSGRAESRHKAGRIFKGLEDDGECSSCQGFASIS